MANQHHLDLLKQGIDVWNEWRKQHPEVKPDLKGALLRKYVLTEADLKEADLEGAELIDANLSRANLRSADLREADLNRAYLISTFLRGANLRSAFLKEAHLMGAYLSNANLSNANLDRANLSNADLSNANLNRANLNRANLSGADLGGADLGGADLREASLVSANLTEAILTNCSIHGISAWDVQLKGAKQDNLVVTRPEQPTITVDNLEVAQFIYLLLNNSKIRDVINTITTKVVLILGRFTPERKVILDALREELRRENYLPILFDFEKPTSRNFTETVRTLAHLARFIIADLTDPRSIPQELQAIIPTLAVPVQPMLHEAHKEYAMFVDLRMYSWVLPTYIYKDEMSLLASLKTKIIGPAEQKAQELEKR